MDYFDVKSGSSVRTVATTVGTVTTTYVGYAAPGTAEDKEEWQISKVVSDTADGSTSVKFAEGTNTYQFSWAIRATYSYS